MADRARRPERLELEIEHSRVELARTIDAIVDRVSPKRMAQRGVLRLKDGAASFAMTVGDAMRSPEDLFMADESADPDVPVEPAAYPDDDHVPITEDDLPRHSGPSAAVVLAGAGVALAAAAVAVVILRRRRRGR